MKPFRLRLINHITISNNGGNDGGNIYVSRETGYLKIYGSLRSKYFHTVMSC